MHKNEGVALKVTALKLFIPPRNMKESYFVYIMSAFSLTDFTNLTVSVLM